jgi:hypothetical protein
MAIYDKAFNDVFSHINSIIKVWQGSGEPQRRERSGRNEGDQGGFGKRRD